MTEPYLDDNSARKRDAWAQREGVDEYTAQIGDYALQRDRHVIGSFLGEGPGRILDIPCGTGRFIALERSKGFQVVAADYSPTMLSVAEQYEGVEFVRADVFDPPFQPAFFDVILISRLMFHYASPERILRHLLPSLKPGGRIVFDTLNPLSSRWVASQCVHAVNRDPAKRLHFEPPGRMRRKLDAMGLKVLDWTTGYILPTRVYKWLPGFIIGTCDLFEHMMPRSLRVVSYWHVTLPG